MTTTENLLQENARLRSLLSDWERTYEQQSVQFKLAKENAHKWEQKFIELERVSTAAPELLAALQEIAEMDGDGNWSTSEFHTVCSIAKAAIAKATQQP